MFSVYYVTDQAGQRPEKPFWNTELVNCTSEGVCFFVCLTAAEPLVRYRINRTVQYTTSSKSWTCELWLSIQLLQVWV